MKSRVSFVLLSLLILISLTCSQNLNEEDYYNNANELMSQEKWPEAEQNFQNILDKYPDGKFASNAMFMVGFINANYTQNYDKAREYYTKFLEKYPDHELADDAEYEIEHLGKSIDDLPFLKGETIDDADEIQGEPPVQTSH